MLKTCLNASPPFADNVDIEPRISIPAIKPLRSLRSKLWRAGTLLAVFVLTLIVGNEFIPREKAVERDMLGHDFTAFYSAGHFASLRQFDKLYDIQAIKDFEQTTGRAAKLTLGDSYGPYWNPPFYAWVFAPFSRLPYGRALFIWTLINVACLVTATVLLCRMLAPPGQSLTDAGIGFKTWGLVPLLLATSMPLLQCLSHGQNTCTSLLLLTITVTFWRTGRAFRAGMIAGLLFYKPQLGAIVAGVLVLNLGWRALFGLSVTGMVLLLVTIATMPGALSNFLHQLPANIRFMQIDHAYVWERHVTLKAFWRLLLQGRAAGESTLLVTLLSTVGCLALGGCLLRAILSRSKGLATENTEKYKTKYFRFASVFSVFSVPNLRRACQSGQILRSLRSLRMTPRRYATPDALIAATVATMPLLMPFYFDYDLLLLAVPAVLFAGGRLQRSTGFQPVSFSSSDIWLPGAWITLYAWLLINPGMAATTRVNLTVALLTVVASLLIARIRSRAASHAAIPLPQVTLPARPQAA